MLYLPTSQKEVHRNEGQLRGDCREPQLLRKKEKQARGKRGDNLPKGKEITRHTFGLTTGGAIKVSQIPQGTKGIGMATDSSNTGRPAGQRFRATGKVTLQRLNGKLRATEGKQLGWVAHGDEAGNGDGAEAVRDPLP